MYPSLLKGLQKYTLEHLCIFEESTVFKPLYECMSNFLGVTYIESYVESYVE